MTNCTVFTPGGDEAVASSVAPSRDTVAAADGMMTVVVGPWATVRVNDWVAVFAWASVAVMVIG